VCVRARTLLCLCAQRTNAIIKRPWFQRALNYSGDHSSSSVLLDTSKAIILLGTFAANPQMPPAYPASPPPPPPPPSHKHTVHALPSNTDNGEALTYTHNDTRTQAYAKHTHTHNILQSGYLGQVFVLSPCARTQTYTHTHNIVPYVLLHAALQHAGIAAAHATMYMHARTHTQPHTHTH
jgi:hypothetical protein